MFAFHMIMKLFCRFNSRNVIVLALIFRSVIQLKLSCMCVCHGIAVWCFMYLFISFTTNIKTETILSPGIVTYFRYLFQLSLDIKQKTGHIVHLEPCTSPLELMSRGTKVRWRGP